MTSFNIELEVALDKIQHNYYVVKKHVAPAEVMVALKANAYGLGMLPVAKCLISAGVSWFGFANLSEALQVKKSLTAKQKKNFKALLLGDFFEQEASSLVQHEIIAPISSYEKALLLSQAARRHKKIAIAHILIDTGMGRLGIPQQKGNQINDATALIERINQLPFIQLQGIYSHLASANYPHKKQTRQQQKRFDGLLDALQKKSISMEKVHFANSDGINNFSGISYNMVRMGINLYGVFDLLGKKAYSLRPTITLKSRLIAKRYLNKKSTIGYSATHVLSKPTWVGTIPIGYADGLPYGASNRGKVLILGELCSIIGNVSMDYITVDLTPCLKQGAHHPAIGDEVILIGSSTHGGKHFAKQSITVEDWARWKNTHPYDIICSLGKRMNVRYTSS